MPAPHYELVIGDKNVSSWSLRPWIAMKRLGLPFSEINIRLRQPDTRSRILVHSPAGKVPVLKVNGQIVWDSLAILEYLAEAHGGLWPAGREPRAMARSVSAEMHSGFAALREHCPMDFLARTPKASLPEAVEADVRRIITSWRTVRSRYGATGPFLFGSFSAADAMYAPVASRFRTYLPDLPRYGDDGTAQAYVETLFAMPEMTAWGEGANSELARA
jgi:glutathione S-transferase